MARTTSFAVISVIVSLCFTLTSCAGIGSGLNEESLGKIKKNVTTKDEIANTFGNPDSKQVDSSGYTTWTYNNVTDLDKAGFLAGLAITAAPAMTLIPGFTFLADAAPIALQGDEKTLMVTFNKKGVVTNYSYTEGR